ncbi:AMP-binding protein [Aliikangiella maris]|uniref:AMP-binding protein n=2 Tax=Aliikangiella maris TaxID=3162458 RepID=A0ABV2BPQ9_9GAMM
MNASNNLQAVNKDYIQQIQFSKATELFESESIIHVMQHHVENRGDKTAFTLLYNANKDDYELSFNDIDRRARSLAVTLGKTINPGDRVILVQPDSEEFIVSLLGCIYAKIIAVPVPRPASNKDWGKIKTILDDCEAKVIALASEDAEIVESWLSDHYPTGHVSVLATDKVGDEHCDEWKMPSVSREDIAFLQYTSGSTGNPKGVMITHGNILHNEMVIQDLTRCDENSALVCWLPLFHDMGLVSFLFLTIYSGANCVLMPTAAFVRQPFRWLKAISDYRACYSGGPNFAYDLLSKRKPNQKQRESLDLSCWTVAANGSEPVRAETLENFSAVYESLGFPETAFCNCYGSAECTLYISSGGHDSAPLIEAFDADYLQKNQIKLADDMGESSNSSIKLVSCGQVVSGQRAIIVDTEKQQKCADETIGEIWLQGEKVSISQGYWGKKDATAETFEATLDGESGTFFRTGDLGFIRNNELFITGREKDLIIISGMNHYPQDIEQTLDSIGGPLRPGGVAAFSVPTAAGEVLVIVQEVKNANLSQEEADEIISQIKFEIFKHHQLPVNAVCLIRSKTIDKTSSGKIQRRLTRQKWLDRQLDVISEMTDEKVNAEYAQQFEKNLEKKQDSATSESDAKSAAVISEWFINWIQTQLSVSRNAIDPKKPFSDFGMDSMDATVAAEQLTQWLGGAKIEPSMFWEFPDIESLSKFLAEDSK